VWWRAEGLPGEIQEERNVGINRIKRTSKKNRSTGKKYRVRARTRRPKSPALSNLIRRGEGKRSLRVRERNVLRTRSGVISHLQTGKKKRRKGRKD